MSVELSQSQSSTKSLLRRGRLGDRSALDRLFARLLRPLRRIAHGRVPRRARNLYETADVVQEAAVGVWRRFDQLQTDEPGDLEAYIRTVVWNRIRDEARRLECRPETVDLDPRLPSDLPSPLDQAAANELWVRCRSAMTMLPVEQRECLIAYFDYGYTYDEAAAVLGRPSGDAVRMSIRRALSDLSELLEP